MDKIYLRGFICLMMASFLAGCTSSKNVEVRRYVEVRDRVDQDMSQGNAGYVGGTPVPEDRSDIRKTRKVYVIEVTDVPPEEEGTVVAEDATAGDSSALDAGGLEPDNVIKVSKDTVASYYDNYKPAPIENSIYDEPSTTLSSAVEYTVQKDDTLQKISKKFYDSYSKWPKIYDANRDVIDNPDVIKPGTVIQIPAK